MSYNDVVSRFKKPQSTNSKLSDKVLVNSEFSSGIGSLFDQNRSLSNPDKKDDGLAGERYALIYKSVFLEGPHQIQDPGVVDVFSSLNIDNYDIVLHYGIAAGTTGITMGSSIDDISRMSRFYELSDNLSSSPTTERDGHVAKIEMLGDNHGVIIAFQEETGRSVEARQKAQPVPPTPPSPPPPPLSPEQGRELDQYLSEVEHKNYQVVKTEQKSDVGKNPLCEIRLNGVAKKENRSGTKLTVLATQETCEKLIKMEKIWDKLRVIYGFQTGNLNVEWPGLIDSISNGYRSEVVNAERGGATNSQHKNGIAIDIARGPGGINWVRLFVEVGFSVGFRAFGIGRGFCHIDSRPSATSWSYKGPVDSYAPPEFVKTINGERRVYGVVAGGKTTTNLNELNRFMPEWKRSLK